MIRRIALALTVTASVIPALADESLPPARYDIGGDTVEQVLDNWRQMFGDVPPVWRVAVSEVQGECDRIHIERYRMPYYQAAEHGEVLLGCLIRDWDHARPEIVIADEFGIGARLLRHEFGHLLGWHGDHRRD